MADSDEGTPVKANMSKVGNFSFIKDGDGPKMTVRQFAEEIGVSSAVANSFVNVLSLAGVVTDTGEKTTGAGMKGARIFQFPATCQIEFSQGLAHG